MSAGATPHTPAVPDLLLRDQLQITLGAGYTLGRELGGGGMSRVYVAHEEALGRDVVVKVLAPELAEGLSAERFAREIRLVAALQEPHIVPVLATGATVDGLPWYTMPYVRGESLRARLAEGPVSLEESVRILRDMLQALSYAHGQGVVHRDIKPENVLLSSGTAVVTDFGIAKALAASKTQAPDGPAGIGLTQLGTSLGTPAYMAPEQAAADPATDHRADLYAWGVVAYELLAGRHPFAGKTSPQQLMAAHFAEAPAPLPKMVPPALGALVARCLAKDPADRPASADDVLALLESGAFSMADGRAPRWRLPLAVAAAVVLVGVAWGGTRWTHGRPAGPVLEPKRVVVATFDNKSGDQSLDPVGAMAADWIARGLANTGVVDVAGTSAELAARGARDAAAVGGGRAALEALAADARAGIVISGAFYRQGDSLLFQADFTDATSHTLVQSVGPVSAPVSRPLDGIERLRQRVAGSLATLVDSSLAGLAGVTSQPPNADAYREFLTAEELFYRDAPASLAHYARAAALDSTYLYPLLRSVNALSNMALNDMSRWAEADSMGRLLSARRARLSAFEQAYLDVTLARLHEDNEAEYRGGMAMQHAAPKSAFAAYTRGIGAVDAGRSHEADSVLGALDPLGGALRGRIFYFTNYGKALHTLGAYDRQLALARRGEEQFPGRLIVYVDEVNALAALGRGAALLARLDIAASIPTDIESVSPARLMIIAIHELRFHGHADVVPAVRDRLLAWLDAHPPARDDEVAQRNAARALIATEQWDRLQPVAASLTARVADDPAPLGLQGVALAMSGDRAGAARVDAQLAAQRSPYQRQDRLEARAGIAAALGNQPASFARYGEAYGPGNLGRGFAHGSFLFDRMRDYRAFLAYLLPKEGDRSLSAQRAWRAAPGGARRWLHAGARAGRRRSFAESFGRPRVARGGARASTGRGPRAVSGRRSLGGRGASPTRWRGGCGRDLCSRRGGRVARRRGRHARSAPALHDDGQRLSRGLDSETGSVHAPRPRPARAGARRGTGGGRVPRASQRCPDGSVATCARA